jgi:hypothetical protein
MLIKISKYKAGDMVMLAANQKSSLIRNLQLLSKLCKLRGVCRMKGWL